MRVLWVMKKQLDVAVDRTVRLEMMKALSRLGHEVTLVTGCKSRREDYGMGDAIRYLDTLGAPFFFHGSFMRSLSRRLPGLLDSVRPKIVVLDPWTAWAGRAVKRLSDGAIPVIVDVRTLPVQLKGVRKIGTEMLFRRGMVAASAHADGMSVITEPLREVLIRKYGVDRTMPHAIWTSGVDVDFFSPESVGSKEADAVRAKWGFARADFVCLYHGTITTSRGLMDLVKAIEEVLPRVREARLLLVGRGDDVEAVVQLARRLGLDSVVRYAGIIPYADVPKYVAACDVGVLPFPDLLGWRVSSPIKLMEYLSMARPVVATDIVAHRSVLGDSGAGFYAADSSPTALSEAIVAAWESGAAVRLEAGGIGRSIVISRFTWNVQARELANLMEAVTG